MRCMPNTMFLVVLLGTVCFGYLAGVIAGWQVRGHYAKDATKKEAGHE